MQQRLRPRLTNDRLIIPPESSSLPLSKAQVSFYKFIAEFSQFQSDLGFQDLSIIAGFCSPLADMFTSCHCTSRKASSQNQLVFKKVLKATFSRVLRLLCTY
ncbi:hypothetical protein C1H46_042064 [Malus baccata]|uniref:Uncharacterized protein n=1 Tax=Malus baccata TaxID=106549 RepID=A0A540KDY3_MALBA|nr:hypothetical protein C1H46_042064 [Malus baccata]